MCGGMVCEGWCVEGWCVRDGVWKYDAREGGRK